ncbi:hypothetical protein H0H81_007148 [Sphagnurus paluster]|uniref:Uncharacterized protein n=1 Tax=Sphagnurus paluster TaxID=117069 RepID=A0A9P7FXK3_9AGAR|nr:hypothetical protein H0H81_007148 [Sphagnurus paluster]
MALTYTVLGAKKTSLELAYDTYLRGNKRLIALTNNLEPFAFTVSCGIIVSAIVKARSATGLSAYHALIALNISQINSWTGYVLLLLRILCAVHQKNLRTKIFFLQIIPYFIHAILVSAFGIYFWRDLAPFMEYASTAPVQPCHPSAYYWILERTVEISDKRLRTISLAYYALSAFPPLNPFPFLSAVPCLVGVCLSIAIFRICWASFLSPMGQRPSESEPNPAETLVSLFGAFTSLCIGHVLWALAICGPFIYTIVSTELTISINRPNVEPGTESEWTYNQTLALFTAIFTVFIYAHEISKMWQTAEPEEEGWTGSSVAEGIYQATGEEQQSLGPESHSNYGATSGSTGV